ncbi:hypothetical protein DFI02_1011234 [Rhizobium sp. PP-F2F-G20b]|nr:hypothetical protein DFI02_1011234 [Rhizobium sp. PP-F2F-G20b]
MKIDGACHCGEIAFEAEIDPDAVSVCHCTDCQQLTGTAYRVTVAVPRDRFALTKGSPKTYVKTVDNGHRRLQMFCPDCGSPIFTTGEGDEAGEIGIRWGNIRQRGDLAPKRQIWCASAMPWLDTVTDLPGKPGD